MDRVLQYNFGYLPPKAGLTSDLPLSSLASKRSQLRALASEAGGGNGWGALKKPKTAQQESLAVPKAIQKRPAEETRCINVIRVLSADMVQQANSGHPGAAMGCAPIAHLLFSKFMAYDPKDPSWPNRDRFVLSNGHACALQYAMLHLTGYELSIEDLKQFRQLGSRTPGHPEQHLTPGVEVATGPLGQGISNGVGLAIAQRHIGANFNKPGFEICNNYTYVICGDGCLQEGISSEACSLAGHLGLGRLIVLYDDNKIQIDGGTDLAFTEDVIKRYQAYGWHTISVEDGDHDLAALEAAIAEARAEISRPTLIKVTTTIGYGSNKAGTAVVHGSALGLADLAQVKRAAGLEEDFFCVPSDVAAHYRKAGSEGEAKHQRWDRLIGNYSAAHPELAAELRRRQTGELPEGWREALPRWKPEDKALATRQSSQIVLNKLAERIPELVGGSADLTPSNLTKFRGALDFQAATPEGRYLRFGVREHAMAAICNGLHAYGGIVPFCATFLNFMGYAAGAIRVSALSGHGVIYIATHDSIGLGEDGPTHQPVESLLNFRATPNVYTIRPADANEVSGAYLIALENRGTPTMIALSRQGVPNLKESSPEAVRQGAYVLQKPEGRPPQLVLVASGSEVGLILQCVAGLEGVAVQVVSMPCWELFDAQPLAYRQSVIPSGVPVLAVESLCAEGWCKYAHSVVGMRSFGASGPAKEVQKHFGFTVENVTAKARELLAFYETRPCHSLIERVDDPVK